MAADRSTGTIAGARREGETMRTHKMRITVPEDRRVLVEFPDSVPPGPIELIVLISAEREETSEKASPDAVARWNAVTAELALDPLPFRELTLEERRVRLRRLRGVGKGLLPSSAEFLRQKREEIELEDRKLAR